MNNSLDIFIIDDDPTIIMLHRAFVSKNKWADKPRTFLNGKLVLDHLKEHDDPAKEYLFLLDINMPVMNGWQLLETLKGSPIAERVHVFMVTSSVDSNDRAMAEKFPFVLGYLEKPLKPMFAELVVGNPILKKFFETTL